MFRVFPFLDSIKFNMTLSGPEKTFCLLHFNINKECKIHLFRRYVKNLIAHLSSDIMKLRESIELSRATVTEDMILGGMFQGLEHRGDFFSGLT